jgi:hypothetical protein
MSAELKKRVHELALDALAAVQQINELTKDSEVLPVLVNGEMLEEHLADLVDETADPVNETVETVRSCVILWGCGSMKANSNIKVRYILTECEAFLQRFGIASPG